MLAPWNAMWTAERRYEIRPCRWAEMRPALWCPHTPGEGKPIFAKPHMVRQRMSISRYLCTVCGKPTPSGDRYWFRLGHYADGWFATTEAPVHLECAKLAERACPHLRQAGHTFERFPPPEVVLSAIVGGAATEHDFGVRIDPSRRVVGHLKFAWRQLPERRRS